ncbi:MAG TPA: hypothetical protein VLH79_06845 [Chthonomonadales bacterium]|nr:hypothetical protein [Chthonomonadales bacterium]
MTPATAAAIAALEAEYSGRMREAAAAATARRDAAHLDAPYRVAGLPVRPMTLVDYLALIAAGNAYVTAQSAPTAERERAAFWSLHLAQALWLLSPEFAPGAAAARDAFLVRLGALPQDRVSADWGDYLHEMFADAPGSPTEETADPPPDPLGVSFAAHWVSALATQYHWSRAEIRAVPLPELFQYLRLVAAAEAGRTGRPYVYLDRNQGRLAAEKLARINQLLAPPAAA